MILLFYSFFLMNLCFLCYKKGCLFKVYLRGYVVFSYVHHVDDVIHVGLTLTALAVVANFLGTDDLLWTRFVACCLGVNIE